METGVTVTAQGRRRIVSVQPAQSEVVSWRNPISGVLKFRCHHHILYKTPVYNMDNTILRARQ